MDKAGHPRPPPLAPECRPARQARRLRHRLCLCRTSSSACRCTSCRGATISAPTNMAAASRIASRLLRESSRTPRMRSATPAPLPCRISVDELIGRGGARTRRKRATSSRMLAELPDLWDLTLSGWENDCQTSRFSPRRPTQEPYVVGIKQLTTKPVVGVGRFTSPDTMVAPRPPGRPRSDRRGAALDRRSRSCRRRSRRAGSRTSANASAATSASPATSP